MVGYKDGMEVDWGCWSQGGTCHNDKPGRVGEQMDFFFGSVLLGSSPGRSALQSAE